MKKLVPLLILGGLLALGAWQFAKRPLSVPSSPGIALPAAPRVAGVAVSAIPTASITSLEAFVVRGGSLTREYTSSIAAFLVEHPKGKLLIDAGAARDIGTHLQTTPWLMRKASKLTFHRSTLDALQQGGVPPSQLDAILLTHSHWDHVSGLADFGDQVPVLVTAEETEYAWQEEGGQLFRELLPQAKLQVDEIQLLDGAYGPFPWSHDYFGDGSVVLLPLDGHTPGSIGILVNLASGKRYLFIGDTAWAAEGVEWPAEKPVWVRGMADSDPALLRDQLAFLHKLNQTNPDIVIVPAHDARVHDRMAQFPDRER